MSAATTSAVPATPARASALPLGTFAAYAAELLGTFVLVLFIVLAVSATAAPPAGTGNVDIVLIGLTHVIALFLLVRSLRAVASVLGPIVGALAAAAAYTEIVLKPQERIEQRPIDTLS